MRQGKYLLFYLLMLLTCSTAQAQQNVVFNTQVSAAKIGLQDQVQVSYSIHNATDLVSLSPGSFADFQVAGGPFQSQQSSINISNGRTVQDVNITISYILIPRKTGKLTVPGATARDAQGHSYQSQPVSLEVVQGSVAASQQRNQPRSYDPFADDPFFQDPFAQRRQQQQQRQQQAQAEPIDASDLSKDIFIKVNVDKTKVHVGEQVTANYKLYARLPMNVGISKLPSLNGFWTQDFEIPKEPKPTEETVNGKKYQVFLLKKSALFPQQTGTLELDPAEAEGIARVVQRVQQRNPFADMFENDPFFQQAFGGSFRMSDPFFDNGFFNQMAYKDVPVHLKSTPVKIMVTPLPEAGKPASYTGAVGKFSINVRADKTEINTEETLNLTLDITGSGNLKLIGAPVLSLPNGLTAYDPIIRDTVTGRSTVISGTKTIVYTLAASVPGDYTIPGISFSYFNPENGQYQTLGTQPLHLHVKAGPGYKEGVKNKKSALTDIHDIHTGAVAFKRPGKPLLHSGIYWLGFALPLGAFFVLLAMRKREEEQSKDLVKLKGRKANKVALRRLATAQKLLKENKRQAYYEEISKAIWLYLSDKFNIPLAQLSKEAAFDALQRKQIPEPVLSRVQQVVSDCELALYSPSGAQQMQNTYREALTVISELEEKI